MNNKKSYPLNEIARCLNAPYRGDGEKIITGFGSISSPAPDRITFCEDKKEFDPQSRSAPGACLTTQELSSLFPNVIIHPMPRLAFINVMKLFFEEEPLPGGVDPRTTVPENASIDPSARIDWPVHIGDAVRIGARSHIHPGVYLGDRTVIGEDAEIFPNVTIYRETAVGSRVRIHSGSVIGSDGFGYVTTHEGHTKFPQVGTVIIEDDVEIGSNVSIDRGAIDNTIIHRGTKIDNLVQIAHNVEVGENTLIAGQAGISGSVTIGDWVVIGGQAGFQGHITVGDRSIIAGQAGVFSSLPANSRVSGYPARDHKQSMRILALLQKLPELWAELKSIRDKLLELEERIRKLNREPGKDTKR